MAGKSTKAQKAEERARLKAQALARKERKEALRRKIIIGTLVGLLVVVIAGFIVSALLKKDDNPAGSSAANQAASQMVRANGEPIVLYKNEVLLSVPAGVKSVEEYFDYGCPICVHAEPFITAKIVDKAVAGDFAFVLQPVQTGTPVDAPGWGYQALAASLQVAQNDSAKWVKFHAALMSKAEELFRSRSAALHDQAAAYRAIKDAGVKAGIDESLLNQLNETQARNYLDKTGKAWEATAKANGWTDLGTPMFVVDKKIIKGDENVKELNPYIDTVYKNIIEALR